MVAGLDTFKSYFAAHGDKVLQSLTARFMAARSAADDHPMGR